MHHVAPLNPLGATAFEALALQLAVIFRHFAAIARAPRGFCPADMTHATLQKFIFAPPGRQGKRAKQRGKEREREKGRKIGKEREKGKKGKERETMRKL